MKEATSPVEIRNKDVSQKIALDLDSTLARTCDTAFKILGVDDEYGYEDIESWSWGLEEFGADRYLTALWQSWVLRPDDLSLVESDAAKEVRRLSEISDGVDIVTAHPKKFDRVTEAKIKWLESLNIDYDEFVVAHDKHELGYGCYIDDKPKLSEVVDDSLVFTYAWKYNEECDNRIIFLSEAYTQLKHREL